MSRLASSSVPRRGFLYRLSQVVAGGSALFIGAAPAKAATLSAGPYGAADPDAWINRLTGEQKTMLHVHQHFMTALVDARTMLANARDSYGVPEAQNSIAIVTHGVAIQGLLRDDVWQSLTLGTYYKVIDPTSGAPATRNIYLNPQDAEPRDAAVLGLMQRGVTFVVCNVALRNLSKRLATRDGSTADAVYGQLANGLVPGAFVVPDLFVSIQRAQKRGVAYIFTDRPR